MMVKRRVIKWSLIATGFLIATGAVGVWGLYWMMRQPMYTFGMVRAGENLRGPLAPPAQPSEALWQVEPDISLSFDERGTGPPVLVVHGGPGIPYTTPWKGFDALTDRFHFYYYHQRGCGDSTRPFDRFENGSYYSNLTELERTLGLGAQIADIERIRRILGHEKITLVGHSFGGFIATLYAAEFPDRVDKLILVAPAGLLTRPDEDRDLFACARAELEGTEQAEFDAVMEEYFDFGNIFTKSDADLAEVHLRVGRYLLAAMNAEIPEDSTIPRSGGWAVFAMYFSTGMSPDYRSALAEISAPTLIIHGEDDTISLPGARTYQPIEHSEFVLLNRENDGQFAGHFIFDESPTEFANVVEEFLAQ